MKRLLVLLLLAGSAFAATPRFDLAAGESRTVELMGATAAWAVDASIVDVSATAGKVTLFARAPGATKIVVISVTGQNAFDVVVAPRRGGGSAAAAGPRERESHGTAEVRYSSAAKEIQNSVAITRHDKTGRTEIAARVVHHAAEPMGDRATTSVPSVSYRIFTRNREVTLLDRDVDHSPLTLSHTPVRGVHYLDEHWRLHAGYTAYAAYQSFLIPVERQTVAGAAYAFRTGPRSTLTPGLFAYRGEGAVLSLLYGYEEKERLSLRAELGYSNSIGGAVQLSFDARKDRVRADVRYRPETFAVAAAGNPRGFFADASWSHAYGRGSNASTTVSASDTAGARVLAASTDFDHRVNDKLSLMSGASFASFANQRTFTIPAGVRLDFARGGIGAIYRYSNHGDGLRVFGRASVGRFAFSAYADRMQNVPTLDAIFAERPDLALALGELGITATSPADVARALREHAILADLGFIEGVTVDLAPMRTQLGLEAAWLGASESRQQVRARLLHNVLEGISSRTTTTIASLTYARRLTASADVFASYSWWRTERGEEARVQPVAEIGVRQHFDGMPSLFAGSGTISGAVFVDEDLDGRSDGTGVAAELELDGLRTVQTNADGKFAFEGVARGTHRLVARVPGKPEAYFTTPSSVEVETGERVAFGVASVPARLLGRVTTDADSGIAGVRVLLARGNAQVVAMTDSQGAFMLAAAPGEWELSILTDSVPAGHSLAGTEARTVMLDRAQPRHTSFALRAHRSVSVTGAQPNATIEVLGKTLRADEQGRVSLRSLPAGQVTFVAGGVEHRVTLPQGPASLALELELAPREQPEVRTVVAGERRDSMRGYVVAIGAFRVRANATDAVERARRNGVNASVDASGALAVVRAGPYTSRADANAAAARLTSAGLEAVVLSRN
ncbi:MAG TPA: SPOR domain-containing protein [Thermoanaerobaculia bacterium]|nr:SPOR domain-containing protein [Thermoanaerobaculia bacterium]